MNGNSGVGFNTRIPFQLSENKNSVLSIPLGYNNKPMNPKMTKQDLEKTSLECGIEVNSCHGIISKMTISSISKNNNQP